MILECPACQSRFLIADAAIGARGRSVRCGRCRHQWHQEPLVGTTILGPLPAPEPTPEPGPQDFIGADFAGMMENDTALSGVVYDERMVPALRPRKPAPRWMRAGAAITLAASLLLALAAHAAWLSEHVPASLTLLRPLGLASSEGLVMSDFAFGQQEAPNGMRYALGCAVRNEGKQTRPLPDMRLRLIGQSGSTLVDEHHLLAPMPRVAPGDEVPCDIPPIVTHTGAAKQIVLDLGGPLELGLRR